METFKILDYTITLNYNRPDYDDGGIPETFDFGKKQTVFTCGVNSLFYNDLFASSVVSEIIKRLYKKAQDSDLDYLQKITINGTRIWCIDDGFAITFLLPDEY